MSCNGTVCNKQLSFDCRNCSFIPGLNNKNCINEVIKFLKKDPSINQICFLRNYVRTYPFSNIKLLKEAILKVPLIKDYKGLFDSLNHLKGTSWHKEVLKLKKKYKRNSEILSAIFHPTIIPNFIKSSLIIEEPFNAKLINKYNNKGTVIKILKEDNGTIYYHLVPKEFNIPLKSSVLINKIIEELYLLNEEEISLDPEDIKNKIINFSRDYLIKEKVSKELQNEFLDLILRYTFGFGLLEYIFMDNNIQDVYIDSPGTSRVHLIHEKFGECVTNLICSEQDIEMIGTKLRMSSSRPFDSSYPMIDCKIEEFNLRACGITEPLTYEGTGFAFRKHRSKPWTLPMFVKNKTFSSEAAGLLSFLVDSQASILITGSRGSGKTSLLNALLCMVPQNNRIILIEDTPEIPVKPMRENGFRIEHLRTKSAVIGGSFELSSQQALRTALRLGESVLVIGEVRSMEAKSLFEAMRVGAVGNSVLGTIHGSGAFDTWDRIVNDLKVPPTSFKAADLVVSCGTLRQGESLSKDRKLTGITEVRKGWRNNPCYENGFYDLMLYDSKLDKLVLNNLRNSELLKKIAKNKKMSLNNIIKSIKARGELIGFLANKDLLSIKDVVSFNNEFRRFASKTKVPNYDKTLKELRKIRN